MTWCAFASICTVAGFVLLVVLVVVAYFMGRGFQKKMDNWWH